MNSRCQAASQLHLFTKFCQSTSCKIFIESISRGCLGLFEALVHLTWSLDASTDFHPHKTFFRRRRRRKKFYGCAAKSQRNFTKIFYFVKKPAFNFFWRMFLLCWWASFWFCWTLASLDEGVPDLKRIKLSCEVCQPAMQWDEQQRVCAWILRIVNNLLVWE